MSRYLIGGKIEGFDSVDNIENISNSEVVYVLTKDEKVADSYINIHKLIKKNNRVIVIYTNDCNDEHFMVARMAVSFGCYDIYKVPVYSAINRAYIEDLLDRTATYEEVQSYVGGEIAAYSEISVLLMKLDEAISNGDDDRIKDVIESNANTLENGVELIDSLRAIAQHSVKEGSSNDDSKLKDKVEELQNKIDRIEEEHRKEVDELNDKIAKAKVIGGKVQQQTLINSPIPLNTGSIRCMATNVLYFKEISYVEYTNTLISSLISIIEKRTNNNVKLLIYDSLEHSGRYKGCKIVNSSNYQISKESLMGIDSCKVVLTEPMQNVLTDVLTSSATKVVVIYDRLYKDADIVHGNNVTKFAVVNSLNDYNSLKDRFKLESCNIITRENSGILKSRSEALDIRNVPGLENGASQSAITTRYSQNKASNGKMLISEIMNLSKVYVV